MNGKQFDRWLQKRCNPTAKDLKKAAAKKRRKAHKRAKAIAKAAGLNVATPRYGKRAPKPPSENFYLCQPWRTLRYAALKNCGGKCQLCGASQHDGVQLHVDHIKPRSTHRHLELDLSNLQVLCEDCNIGKGAWDDTDWRVVRQD